MVSCAVKEKRKALGFPFFLLLKELLILLLRDWSGARVFAAIRAPFCTGEICAVTVKATVATNTRLAPNFLILFHIVFPFLVLMYCKYDIFERKTKIAYGTRLSMQQTKKGKLFSFPFYKFYIL